MVYEGDAEEEVDDAHSVVATLVKPEVDEFPPRLSFTESDRLLDDGDLERRLEGDEIGDREQCCDDVDEDDEDGGGEEDVRRRAR